MQPIEYSLLSTELARPDELAFLALESLFQAHSGASPDYRIQDMMEIATLFQAATRQGMRP